MTHWAYSVVRSKGNPQDYVHEIAAVSFRMDYGREKKKRPAINSSGRAARSAEVSSHSCHL